MARLARCFLRSAALLGPVGRWPVSALRDRRGVTAPLFAAISVSLLGIVGLGTDAGLWYLAQAQAQSAADAAALAGALSLAEGSGQTAASTAATSVAGQNGFASGTATTVTINMPPSSGTYTGSNVAVEAIISQTQTRYLSRLFLTSDPVVSVRAVAEAVNIGSACAVATGNVTSALLLGGNSTITGSNCALASNSTASPAIDVNGSPTVSASSLVSVGTCSGCSGANLPPWQQTALPVANPFAAADSTQLPSFSNCQTPNFSQTIPPYNQSTNPVAYCGFTLNNGSKAAVTLQPGTYFFASSIDLEGGSVSCPTCTGSAGVTIVLTHTTGGTNAGLTINGNFDNSSATITLQAPAQNTTTYNGNQLSGLDGLLFYSDPTGTQSPITINGNSNVVVQGGLYFPQAPVTFNGNTKFNSTSGTDQPISTCLALVANSIDASGNSTTAFDTSGCSSTYGQNFGAQIQAVRLVE